MFWTDFLSSGMIPQYQPTPFFVVSVMSVLADNVLYICAKNVDRAFKRHWCAFSMG